MKNRIPAVLVTGLAFAAAYAAFTPWGFLWTIIQQLMHRASSGAYSAIFWIALFWVTTFLILIWLIRWPCRVASRCEKFGAVRTGSSCGLVAACLASVSDLGVQFFSGKSFIPPLIPHTFEQWGILVALHVVISPVVESVLIGMLFILVERRGFRVGPRVVTLVALAVAALHLFIAPALIIPSTAILFITFNAAWPLMRNKGHGVSAAAAAMAIAHAVSNFLGLVRSVSPYL